jgi:CNT family concentrative nucleoside transporter
MMDRFISFLGLFVLVGLAWLMSNNKKKMNWRLIFSGIGLQIVFGMLILWTTPGRMFFDAARVFITKIISFSDSGSAMLFGEGFREHFFAFSVLPTIIFVSSVMSVLFYLGVMQKIVNLMSHIMVKVMDVSGSESLAASANVFVGQTEAPLVVLPYIGTMTRSELMAMMTGGMATIAGGVMAAYVSFGADPGHLLAASIMSAPAALVIAKIMIPEVEKSKTKGVVKAKVEISDQNILDAACRGASDGLKLALNVAAMLIAFVAIAALINYLLSLFGSVGGEVLSVERILGWIFAPIAFLLGVPAADLFHVGSLLGKKMFLNEFIAYLDLKDLKGVISDRSFMLSTYALCGFANFSSIAIQIGGIGALVPGRRKDFAKIGLQAMLGGTLAALMTACVAGMLISH